MKKLIKNASVFNVFTEEFRKENILIENGKIIGIGDYQQADIVYDYEGKYVIPGLIDGHIHIESTMLTPASLAEILLAHGTTSIVADPHEIANVCGTDGIEYMLQSSENLPMNIFIMLPSCVPATGFDESGAVLNSEDLYPFYANERVLGLAEMMNYPGLIFGDAEVHKKISDCLSFNKVVDGHAPLLSGNDLDKYVSAKVYSDHECSNISEAKEKLAKGQWIMVREGSAAKNLNDLIELFDAPYYQRCLLATDDRNPADLIKEGHIDNIIRKALKAGKDFAHIIKMATYNAASRFRIPDRGAIADGYIADLTVLNNIDNFEICDVFTNGNRVVENGITVPFENPSVEERLINRVQASFHLSPLKEEDFLLYSDRKKARAIKVIPGQIITNELIIEPDLNKNNGIDLQKDIIKVAVIERHNNTNHKMVGFINGIGLKSGAIASSISHDSHNLIVIGTNEKDMAFAANSLIELGGGNIAVKNQQIISQLKLPIAGLMSDEKAETTAKQNIEVREAVKTLGINENIEPFMNMAFVSLDVIPSLKMSTTSLIDVNCFKKVELFF